MSSIQQYWPPIRDAIEVNNDPSQPNSTIRAQCPICMEDVAVTSFLLSHSAKPLFLAQTQISARFFSAATFYASNVVFPMKLPVTPSRTAHVPCVALLCSASTAENPPRECQATAEVGESIQQGDWPEGLQDLEPGFVPLFYHLAGKLEQQGYAVSPRNLVDAFATIIEDEFLEMVTGRVQAIQGRHAALEGQTPWFADDPDTPVPRPTDLPGGGQRLQRLVPQEDNWPLSGTSPAGPAPQQNPWGPIGEAVPQGLPTPTSPLARPAMQPFDMRSPPSFEGFFGQRSENRPTFSLSEMSAGQAINLTSPTTQWMAFPSSSSPFIEVHTEAAPSTAHAVRAVDPTTPLFSPAAHPSAHEALMREVIEERFGAGLDITASVAELMADRLRRQRPISPLVAWSRGPTLDDREVINRHAVAAMNAHMVAEMSSNSGWDRFGFSHHDNSNDDDYIDFEDLLPSTDDEVTNGDDGNDDRDDSGDYYDLIISADSDTDSEDEDVEMAPAPDFFSYV
ncbi:hypothetical protein NXS19_011421 [Fusarium pseudograminearum]|nr:hypothetical protein NXS19_011421 [Fusarium pseudograminearum]